MSNMFFPHSPSLTLFFCFCLFFSFSYAHYKHHENPTCDCATAHNNSHEKIPTKARNSPPALNSSQEIPTKPSNSAPAHNSSHEVPTKPGNSSPAHNSSHEVPTKPGNSSPAHNSSHEVPTKPGNPSPAHNSSHEVPTKPGAHNSSNEVPTKPGNSSPLNNNSHDTSTRHNNFIGCFHKVYAFGDSYTDTGNANLVGGLKENFTRTSSSSEKSNNGLCDGHLMVDFLCDALKLPHLPPFQSTSVNFTNGANFAIAGSTILPKQDFLTQKLTSLFWKGIPLNFQTQIDWFNKLKQQMGCTDNNGKSCKTELENALFWIGSVGVSDYARIQGSSLSTRWLTQQSVQQVSRLIEAVLQSGAKYIVVQGLPPIGCLPLHISLCPVKAALDHMGCAAAVNAAVMVHNQILQRRLEKFRRLYPNCHILYADYWNAYLTIKMNLQKYQFEEAFKPCCGAVEGPLNFNLHSLCGSPGTVKCNNPSKFISWDGIHLSEAMNQKVTDLFLNQGFCQPSFSELVKSKSGM
ncbi:GDSL esterase/lipase At3g48460-like [Lycium barbarum]|uniref:GDSL esterase/lipase At3g48460-like n=1 Tax=Lycium barbarum TaxID=112863 RepID=UPI00293E76BE|nr:GDSL esterase/lipase At3g48460-like [Lycium barbarum]